LMEKWIIEYINDLSGANLEVIVRQDLNQISS
jgi:hypothetical protein